MFRFRPASVLVVVFCVLCALLMLRPTAAQTTADKPEPRQADTEAFLSNNLLQVHISERDSRVWYYQYAPGTWGESNYHELFAIYTPSVGTAESPNFTVEQPFSNPNGGPGSVSSVVSNSLFRVTRTVVMPSGDARYFRIEYDIANKTGATIPDVRFFQAIDFDIPRTGDHTDDYGWYDPATDYIGVRDLDTFRNIVVSVPRSDNHSVDFWSRQIYSDWDDGNLLGQNSYGPGDPAIAKQFNFGNLAANGSRRVTFYIWFGDPTTTDETCLEGKLRDEHNTGLVGASVQLIAQGTQQERATLTDAAGDFRFDDLAPGRYQVRATKQNYSIYIAAVNLGAGCTRLDPRLWPAESSDVIQLSRVKAPTIYQDTDDASDLADFLTSANFDGNWDSTDNWQHTTTHDLRAYVYWEAVSTTTHHYLKYYRFYPRDWGEFILGSEHTCLTDNEGRLDLPARCHENDLEGSAIAVNRETNEIEFMVVARHGWQTSKCEADASRGELTVVEVERMTHAGTCRYANDTIAFEDNNGVIYRYEDGVVDIPESNNDRNVRYGLLHVNDLRWLIGTADGARAYTPNNQRFLGNDYGDNKAATPWALPIDDVPDGTRRDAAMPTDLVYQGDLYADPARLFASLFPDAGISTEYTFNPNLTAAVEYDPASGGWAATPAGEASVFLPFGAVDSAATVTLGYDVPAGLPVGGAARAGEPATLLGRPFVLRATRTGGGEVTAFNAPLQMEVGFSAADLEVLEVGAADVSVAYWDGNAWRSLPTQVDEANELAVAYTDAPGVYALFAGEAEVAVAAPIFLPVAMVIPYVPPAIPLLNGDFEAGAVNWTRSSTYNWPIIVNSDQVEDLPTHSGIWIAWLGGDDNEVSYIEQAVTVPADRPYLTYYHGIASQDACGYDYGRVLVNGTAVEAYTLCRSANTPDWAYRVVNLSAFAGQTVALQFRATTDGSLNSNLLIDDVAFRNAAAAAARAAPVPFRWPAGVTR